MTPFAYKVIQDVAAEWGINPELMTVKCRRKRIVCARVDAVKRMQAHGYSAAMIGKQFGLDHTTILYYLGRYKRRRPSGPDWRAPMVRHLRWIKPGKKPRQPTKIARYLVPYAGADWTEYRWKERPKLEIAHEHRTGDRPGDAAAARRAA